MLIFYSYLIKLSGVGQAGAHGKGKGNAAENGESENMDA